MAYRVSCYTHSPHLNILRSFKIVIYLILEHIYTSSINTFPWQSIPLIYRSLRKCILSYVQFAPFFSQRPTMSSCSVVCPIFKKHATIQTFYPVCYLKNFYLVITDSSCLQSCQFTLLYSIFITENSEFRNKFCCSALYSF